MSFTPEQEAILEPLSPEELELLVVAAKGQHAENVKANLAVEKAREIEAVNAKYADMLVEAETACVAIKVELEATSTRIAEALIEATGVLSPGNIGIVTEGVTPRNGGPVIEPLEG